MTVSFFPFMTMAVTVTMSTSVTVPMAVSSLSVVRMRLDGVRNQMKESITQKPSGREGQQSLQPWLHLFRVIERNGKQDKERCGTDQQSRSQRMHPDVEGVDLSFIL